MLSHDKESRPTISDVLYHPFFRSWEENFNVIDGLYRVLHNGNGTPVRNGNFELAQSILLPLEAETDGPARLAELPSTLQARIRTSRDVPQLLNQDGTLYGNHPMPNLHACVQWVRHFLVHFRDHPTFTHIHAELQQHSLVEGDSSSQEAVGNFLYRCSAVWWLLPSLWQAHVAYLRNLDAQRAQLTRAWEAATETYEAGKEEVKSMERKSKTLFSEFFSATPLNSAPVIFVRLKSSFFSNISPICYNV